MSPVMNLVKEKYQQEPHRLNRTKGTHIATTYAGISDIHKNIVRVLEFWDGPVFKLNLVDAFEDKGQVLTESLLVSSFAVQDLAASFTFAVADCVLMAAIV